MDHHDHVNLLRAGVAPGGLWADFGSGRGAFTLALAELLGPEAQIISIDRDRGALQAQERAMRSRFPQASVQYLPADFTQPLDLPPLAGALLANSLHFQRDKGPVLSLLKGYLQPGGRLVLVEYNIERGNAAVPYPVSFGAWCELARQTGFAETRLLSTRPSRFLREIYVAASLLPKGLDA